MNWKEVEELKPLKEYDAESILSKELFEEIFAEEDLIERSYMIAEFSIKAKELKVKSQFDAIIKSHEKVLRQIDREDKINSFTSSSGRITEFSIPAGKKYSNMHCGSWFATDSGIYSLNVMGMEQRASRQPILPIERLENMETGEERIVLAFKKMEKGNHWKELPVAKSKIASVSKIIELADYGVSVTSESAKHLIKYLNDIEAFNVENIPIALSSSKLGWHGDDFLPYEGDIVFDGDSQFKHVYEAICEHGTYSKWLEHVKEIRKTKRLEAKFMLAASFASILIKPLGVLPFIVDLWGETGGGKSVSLMLACSVWANPDEHQYIGDFESTGVQTEVRADMLNHLPVILDDTSKMSDKVRDNFEGLVYSLCSGKGKSRSNKDLGIRRENTWKNCILTNGERPLQSYVSQGGAINRILEVDCGATDIYVDPQKTTSVLKGNYGFAGKQFVEVVKELGVDEIKRIYQDFCKKLFSENKMQKQAMALAVVLTADKIATECIFMDKCYISLDEAKETLVDKNMISDNERCYQYLLDKVAMNSVRFDGTSGIEKWGTIENSVAYFYPHAFEDLCKSEGFSKKSFILWADRKNLILTEGGRTTKQKKIAGKNFRCIALKLEPIDDDGFLKVEEPLDDLPFT